MNKLIVCGILAVSAALAQPPGPPPGRMGGFGGRGPMGPGAFSRTVTGAPYSATEVTMSQQVLPDGNVIQRQNQTTFYRDGQGRTRTETTMKHPDGTTTQHVMVHDPVAGVIHEIDPQNKVSRDSMFNAPQRDSTFHVPQEGAGGAGRPQGMRGPQGQDRAMAQGRAANPNVSTENLGTQTINGVSATGTRIVHTIPAGAEGNSLSIQVVHETWVSDELKVPVMVKHSDPRSGTTTTQLTNIVRAEPDPSLFSVPAGYAVKQGGPGRGMGRGPRQ
jgi:hypothetical protein